MRYFNLLLCGFLLLCLSFSASSQELTPNIYQHNEAGNRIVFYGDNPAPIPYWVTIKFSKLTGFNTSAKSYQFQLSPDSIKVKLFELTFNANVQYSISYKVKSVPGYDPDTVIHKENYRYLLPFEHGKKYKVGQGYNGKATHQPPHQFAIDFNMDINSVVSAARGGTVAWIKQDSNKGGNNKKYSIYANHVGIFHQDGTFATYAHLKKNGVLVKRGQQITAGQALGYSGNTGYSSGPHLHFSIYKYNTSGDTQSIATQFINHDSTILSGLTEGLYYFATHPKKPPYPVDLGHLLVNKDFDDDKKSAAQDDQFKIIIKRIDDVIVLFGRNGTPDALDIQLDLSLENLESSKTKKIKTTIPALTEQFLTILKSIDSSKGTGYAYKLRQHIAINPVIK